MFGNRSKDGSSGSRRRSISMLAYSVSYEAFLTRRRLLLAMAATAGCSRRKGRGFPGYAFVANAGGRTIAAVDLDRLLLAQQIGLDSSPSAVLRCPWRPAACVLSPETGTLCEIDAEKLVVSRKARLGAPAISVKIAAEKGSLWVLQSQSLVNIEHNRFRPAK